jgi:cyanophycinase
MTGMIALLGSGEYLEVMDDVDRRLLKDARHAVPRVVCLPTAAGPEGRASIDRWSNMGVAHFRRLGAEVEPVLVIDRASADDPKWTALIREADLIYFSGGDPFYLHRTLIGTQAWEAVTSAVARGAALAGCSAGAMILGEYLPGLRPIRFDFSPAFGLVPRSVIFPHFDRFPFRRAVMALVRRQLADSAFVLGIDENTALVGRAGEDWDVMGASRVSLFTRGGTSMYPAGSRLSLPAR